MWHWLVMSVLAAAFGNGPFESLAVAAVTLVLSALTVRYLILPMEQLRQATPGSAKGDASWAARWPTLWPLLRPLRLVPEAVDRRRPTGRH